MLAAGFAALLQLLVFLRLGAAVALPPKGSSAATRAPKVSTPAPTQRAGTRPSTNACGVV